MIRAWIRDWVKRNIIDDDPHQPEPTHGPGFDGRYYADDESEGLQPTPYGGMEDRAGFAALAHQHRTAA